MTDGEATLVKYDITKTISGKISIRTRSRMVNNVTRRKMADKTLHNAGKLQRKVIEEQMMAVAVDATTAALGKPEHRSLGDSVV